MNSISHLMCSVVIRCVCTYQKASSLMRFYPTCKYVPTCSEYMILVLRKHGLIYGLVLGLWRILRCNPFSKGGLDMP